MHAVNVSTLKNNPTQALSWAQTEPVIVFNRNTPQAIIVGTSAMPSEHEPDVRLALALALFNGNGLSVFQAAKYAQCTVQRFMQQASRLGIAMIKHPASEVTQDLDTLTHWLAQPAKTDVSTQAT
jgi:predicted HTH domain antitoxin